MLEASTGNLLPEHVKSCTFCKRAAPKEAGRATPTLAHTQMLKNLFSIHSVRALATFAVVALAAGCGSDKDDNVTGVPTLGSSFTATLTGGGAGTYTGLSAAAAQVGAFTIVMTSTDGKFVLGFTRNSGGRPATGSYPIVGNPQNGFTAVMSVNSNQFIYTSTSGTLTITASSGSEIKGTFSLQAQASGGGGSATSATGSFTSTCSGC
jgi:hypothetical protein